MPTHNLYCYSRENVLFTDEAVPNREQLWHEFLILFGLVRPRPRVQSWCVPSAQSVRIAWSVRNSASILSRVAGWWRELADALSRVPADPPFADVRLSPLRARPRGAEAPAAPDTRKEASEILMRRSVL
jgi:hypothetical protein